MVIKEKSLKILLEYLQFNFSKEYYWKNRLASFYRKGTWRNMDKNKFDEKRNKLKGIFLDLCKKEKINFKNIKVLDIGCGDGFYTKILFENNVKNYLGIDIADVLFDKFENKFNKFQFKKLDIIKQRIKGKFDLILLIDTIQHITKKKDFYFVMETIKSCLSKRGVIFITSFLKNDVKNFYEKSYTLEDFRKVFSDYSFDNFLPFDNKFIFTIRKW